MRLHLNLRLRRLTTTAALTGWFLGCSMAPCASAAEETTPDQPAAANATVVLPEGVPDPIEPLNRVMWRFNQGLMVGVIKPTARVYRTVVKKPVRNGIQNFGRNITYPGRLVNNLLQGKWAGARDETYRFGCNTVLGLGGFIDVATKFDIPKWDADFGETFGQWGWKPQAFVMLPIFGPSNDRDTVGLAADTAANPLTYLSPYRFSASRPYTYLGPYSYASHVITYNNLSDKVDDYVRFTRTEKDAYSELAYAWTFVRQNRVVDYREKGEPDQASLETLQSVFFSFKDPEFPTRGQTRSVLIPSTGDRLKFTYWLQPRRAPLICIVPGLGSHRLASTALALAELVYHNGFSAVCVSSPFNYDFMEHASSVALPANTPIDAADLHLALTEINRELEREYPDRLGSRALLGYSMGGFQSLFVAANRPNSSWPLIKFDRYVAINSPVRLLYGTAKLDEFFQAPLAWPPEERATNIENTFLKVAALTQNSLTPQTSVPFSGIESKFLIGTVFRLILRDVIFSSQERNSQGVLQHPIRRLRREPLYREIMQFSFDDYFNRFVRPYYSSRGLDLTASETLEQLGDLRRYGTELGANPDIRLIANRNDFLLDDTDLQWLASVFGPDRLRIFEQGGHLGNLDHPDVQQAILNALSGLQNN